MDVFNKILTWVRVNGATVLGLVQATLKAIKEILTGVINLLSLFISATSAQAFVVKVRDLVNAADTLVENWKFELLKVL